MKILSHVRQLGYVVGLAWLLASGAFADTNKMRYLTTPPQLATGDLVEQQADANGALVVQFNSTAVNTWQYAAASGGILNTTTAVTMKTAAAAGLRNYITSCQVMSEALGAATELAIRDGAAGTVIWRTKIGAAGIVNGETFVFAEALRGTAATLLEAVTLTASVTGAVYINCQGYIAP